MNEQLGLPSYNIYLQLLPSHTCYYYNSFLVHFFPCYPILSFSVSVQQQHRLKRPSPILPLMSGSPSLLQGRLYSTSNKSPQLTHTDAETGRAKMVSVTAKDVTHRTAHAEGSILLPETTFKLLSKTTVMKKGDVLTVAQIAGIQAAKQTSMLIPLCHPLLLTNIQVNLQLNSEKQSVDCQTVVECRGNTGVEMEALTAVNVALLTVFDMCKAAGHGMEMTGIKVTSKTGGKSDFCT